MPSKNEQQLLDELQKISLNLSNEQFEKLLTYLKRMLEVNQHMNLTAIKDYDEGLFKHLYDALLVVQEPIFLNAKKILDLGSGGGVPAIPLAIAFPDKQIFSLDATRKKIDFQQETAEMLGLSNFNPLWDRAEVLGHDAEYRGQFDLVTARAVAAVPILNEIMLPFAKIDGHILMYKGKEAQEEITSAKQSFKKLNAQFLKADFFETPNDYGTRALVLIKKIAATPREFPRKPGIPQKKPLK